MTAMTVAKIPKPRPSRRYRKEPNPQTTIGRLLWEIVLNNGGSYREFEKKVHAYWQEKHPDAFPALLPYLRLPRSTLSLFINKGSEEHFEDGRYNRMPLEMLFAIAPFVPKKYTKKYSSLQTSYLSPELLYLFELSALRVEEIKIMSANFKNLITEQIQQRGSVEALADALLGQIAPSRLRRFASGTALPELPECNVLQVALEGLSAEAIYRLAHGTSTNGMSDRD